MCVVQGDLCDFRDRMTGNDAVGTIYLNLAKIASSGGEVEGIMFVTVYSQAWVLCKKKKLSKDYKLLCFYFFICLNVSFLKGTSIDCFFLFPFEIEEHARNVEISSFEGSPELFFFALFCMQSNAL